MASRSRVGFDDRESVYRDDRRSNVEVRVMDRERERERDRDRVPTFLRDDIRRPEPGPLVLRQREVETSERIRRRSPSPIRHVRARSVSPVQMRRTEEDLRFRTVRAPSRGPSEVDRVRIIERDRSSSPSPERVRARFVERRPRSPSPDYHEHIRIVEKERERERPRSPTPPPQPQIIKGPIIEREVITHYRDIDHGMFSLFVLLLLWSKTDNLQASWLCANLLHPPLPSLAGGKTPTLISTPRARRRRSTSSAPLAADPLGNPVATAVGPAPSPERGYRALTATRASCLSMPIQAVSMLMWKPDAATRTDGGLTRKRPLVTTTTSTTNRARSHPGLTPAGGWARLGTA